MKKRKEFAAILTGAAVFLLCVSLAAAVLIPPRTCYGVNWKSYRLEEKDSLDVLFFGSSVVYCDIIPSEIYRESGLGSYIVSGPEQTMPISYYYVRNALRTQSPQAVVLELSGMFFRRYQDYTLANLSYMPYGADRVSAALRTAEPERRAGLLLPILDYHDRWYSVTLTEARQSLFPESDPLCGYTFLSESSPQTLSSYRERVDIEAYELALGYLRDISGLCSEHGAKLILYLAPAMTRPDPDDLDMLMRDLESVQYDAFRDFGSTEPEGIDNNTDWFDPLHFNYPGAVKFSRLFADFITDCGIVSGNADPGLWRSRCEYSDALWNDAV